RGLFAPGAIPIDHRAPGVGEEGERQRELLAEPAMAGGTVLADAPDVGVGGRVRLVEVAELAGLGVAAWRVVLGIEVQDGPAALLVGQVMDRAGLVGERHVRRHLADLRRGPRVGRHGRTVTGVSITRSWPALISTLAFEAILTFDRPRDEPRPSSSFRSGYLRPSVVIPSAPATLRSVTRSPARPASSIAPGAVRSEIRAARSS